MPEFLEEPSVLTKDKLKSELLANDVPLPPGDQKKDIYVQLYKQHLTVRNRATPDFSSDEDRESTPMRGRGRPPGRKATKKTNKPNTEEEKSEQDVTELSNEALKEELLKYGVNPGPIMGSTRKVYEKRLLKVKEQQVTSLTSLGDASNADTKQNGNSDSAQYSDNEESKIDLAFETREPIRGKSKIQVTSRSRRLEQNENISGDSLPEPPKIVEPEKVGRVQAISKESSRVARRTPRKRVVASEQVPDDDADDTDPSPGTETVLPSSNKAPVDIQVTEVFKHTNSLRVSEFSELSRRTPKKQTISDKVVEKTYIEERRDNRDVLKEMFPYEVSTPTGISATCRRPIKGAAGRPLSLKDYKIEESYTTKYVPKYQSVIDEKPKNLKTGRSIPMWIKILLFVVLAVFSFLVYQVMETNQGNPFTMFLMGENVSKTEN